MKKGFTLIELLTVMAVISIIYGISYINITSYKKIENKIDYENTNNFILSFMNNSKLKCKSMKKSGYIYIPEESNIIDFRIEGTVLDKLILPRGFKIKQLKLPTDNNYITISYLGYSYDAGTILYYDREGVTHAISMTVGQDYAEIKN